MKGSLYARYAEAVIRVENKLTVKDEITVKNLAQEIEKGLNSFKVYAPNFYGKEKTVYQYKKGLEGKPDSGHFLAPNIIAKEQRAHETWKVCNDILEQISENSLDRVQDIKMAIAPIAGEYLRFGETSAARGKPKLPLKDIALCAITTITTTKPCLQFTQAKKTGSVRENTCFIPDLSIEDLMDFVIVYKRMLLSKTCSDLMIGPVHRKVENKRGNEATVYQPRRPLIFRGNFPNPPRSSALGSIALLGAIGEFAKEADVSTLAQKVLDSLKGTTIYMIKYGDASCFRYNHHVIDLAREGKLGPLVDAIYYSELYNEGRRTHNNVEYQKFDLFSNRFLQQFNRPALKDFLSYRAEYPNIIPNLFNTYFKKIEMIDPEIVSSARKLGRWLNQVAYFAAKSEIKQGTFNYWEELRKAKSKILVELESSTFSAKTGDALIAQAITRAGRLSGMDAPEGAALFMEKTSSGELELDNAKNLLIAFSRIKNKAQQRDSPQDPLLDENMEEELEDLSNE